MIFDNIKDAVGLEEVSNELAPGLQISEPMQDPIGGEDDVEFALEYGKPGDGDDLRYHCRFQCKARIEYDP